MLASCAFRSVTGLCVGIGGLGALPMPKMGSAGALGEGAGHSNEYQYYLKRIRRENKISGPVPARASEPEHCKGTIGKKLLYVFLSRGLVPAEQEKGQNTLPLHELQRRHYHQTEKNLGFLQPTYPRPR